MNVKSFRFSLKDVIFAAAASLVVVCGAYVGFSVSAEYKRAREKGSMQSAVISGMDIKPSEEMSIQKIRQWYVALGQTISISQLLDVYPREMKNFDQAQPSIFLFFSSSSCQTCVGEMFEHVGEVASAANLNVVSICASPTIVQGLMYKPRGIAKSCFVIDTTADRASFPSWIHISPVKPMVFFTDASGSVLNAYFLQEKDFETRKRFAESVKRLLTLKEQKWKAQNLQNWD